MTKNDFVNLLGENNLVVIKGNNLYSYNERGIKSLIEILKTDKDFLKDSIVIDKLIGKAAASLLSYGQVKEVYTLLISEQAIPVFKKQHIHFEYIDKCPYIIRRDGKGMCPMEETVQDIEDPSVAFKALLQKLEHLGGQ